ncbi:MAG: hypothetical protein ACRD0C_21620, partial [Acidimicrobiia bacterium]
MDLQRRISRLLAIAGTALLASGVVAGALIGDAAAAPRKQPDKPDHAGSTTTTSDAPTTTTRKSKPTTTTTAAPTTTTTPAPTTTTAQPTTTTSAPTTTTTLAPTTTTTAAPTTTTTAGQAAHSQGENTYAAQ